ncbi:MAG: sigma-70 family RNA polymerase sigma factor [Deltaproteobacteria bacterium]|nr:sigma-70 family RNA polymerase sigma factor [Deltaproteobacteria bacterium]
METVTDEKLMTMYAGGDASAFRELFSRYEKRIYNFFLRRLGDPDRAADLFQETFLRLHQNRRRFDSRYPFTAWFYTIANNLVRDELRRKRGVQFDAMEAEDSLPPSRLAGPEESMAAAEFKEKLERALEMLSQAQKEVLILSRFEGLKHGVIARITGRSEVAVRQLLYRALQNLRGHLTEG